MDKKLIVLGLLCLSFLLVNAQQLTIGTYNVRNDNQGDANQGNGWAQRRMIIAGLVSFNDFDIWGSQEVLHNQLEDILLAMPQYGHIGVGRDDGKTKGEYAPIFYKKDKFTLIKHGDFWLSEDTTQPNRGWDAALPRICTWGQFKDNKSKFKFWFFNLHMDHVGVEARRQSAKLVLQKIKEMCGNDAVLLTGDFNVDQTHESYRLLNESEILRDSYDKAAMRYATNGTFNGWDTTLKTDSRIDHIFLTKHFEVERYGVLTDTYRSEKTGSKTIQTGDFPKEVSFEEYEVRLPSDHFPVKIIVKYKK
ncbi:endonuclease/exonuclease/phosphatase family protein [Bacteroides sp. OttesenSCG-928-D19]|nr:endonuclease/exonuclease/phosphatase family protein [Bacteroides sp. OttesenSCG-928-D19]